MKNEKYNKNRYDDEILNDFYKNNMNINNK